MAQHSISPNRWPPNCALPPSGCWVIIEYGPVERAWILSSTRWCSFMMYIKPTVTGYGNGSPLRPSNSTALPSLLTSTSPSRLGSVEASRPCSSSSLAPSNTGVDTMLFGPLRHAACDVDLPPAVSTPPEVGLQDLADVHPSRHTVGVEDDVHGRAVRQERHVLGGQDLADHTLVAMATRELVTVGDLAFLGDVDADQLVDTR